MTERPTLDDARAMLRARFGYPDFRPGQERAVESVLAGRDTMVILPTGGGKSLCFQVPALLLPRLTIVISPLISLMKDQVDALAARGLPATFINSTLSSSQVADRLTRAERGEIKLLYLAPERFDVGRVAERLAASGVSLLAVDEAHCVSEWGHDFRPSYLRIREVRERLGAPPTVALTATATPEVRRDIAKHLHLRTPETVITGFDRRNLHYHVIATRTDQQKDQALVELLAARQGQAVIYASTRRAVERIAQALDRARVSAVAYHAGLDDAHRHEVQELFMHEGARAIVATNAFGMGIDKPNVRLVVHYTMPGTLEAYYQEAGRAGRDGGHSDCVLLHAFPDRFTHEFFIKSNYPEPKRVELIYDGLCRLADAAGLVSATTSDLPSLLPGGMKEREIDSALRLLDRAGAVSSEPASTSRLFVRLLATPERIRRELGAGHEAERDLLRALWRGAGTRIQTGAVIDPDGLPPGFGGSAGVTATLDSLQQRQFVLWERTGGGLRVVRPAGAKRGSGLAAFDLDWDGLARRQRAEMAKLEAMQRYAYTSGCRRAFVLRYFGDPAARPTCEGCDNCLGTHREAQPAAASCAGSRSRAKTRTDRLTGRPAARAGDAELPELSPADGRLLAELKTLRATLARDGKVPAYVIFADRTLMEIAVRRPRSLGALGDVRGVGPTKLERYGERFLALVRGANDIEAA